MNAHTTTTTNDTSTVDRGATSMGPNGAEVLGLVTLAVHACVPIKELRSMSYASPTFHRGIEDALRNHS